MDADAASAASLGAAIRRGVVLSAVEAVAVTYEVVRQVSDGRAPRIADTPAELTLDDGRLVTQATGVGEGTHPAAALLDALLPSDRSQVPASLRTLPERLRAAADEPKPNLTDLLAVLRWHLNAEPADVLRALSERLAPGASKQFAWSDTPEKPQPVEAVPSAVMAVPSAAKAVPSAVQDIGDVPLRRAEVLPWPGPPPRRRTASRAMIAVAALAAIALSGYLGFQLTAQPASAARTESIDAPREAPAVEPRVKVAGAASKTDDDVTEPRVEPLPLQVEGGVFSPSFSPDGSALYFHNGREAGRLLEASLDAAGGSLQPRSVLDDRARNYHARPSPDGKWIAFDSDRNGTRAVYVMALDGGGVEKVSGQGFAIIPSWSPDMKWLAFVRAEPSRPRVWNLWLRDMSSGALKRISAFRNGQVWSASWFADGRAICYSHEDQLIVHDLETGRDRIFETPIRGRLTRTPAVSPDGSRIVFQVLGDGVWMLDVASGAMRRVLDDGTAEEFAWDPRGRRIAYHSRRDGRWHIWLMTL